MEFLTHAHVLAESILYIFISMFIVINYTIYYEIIKTELF